MGQGTSYTEQDDQFLIDNCINGDMTYGEAAKRLGRSGGKVIGMRISKIKAIYNFKKNTIQKSTAETDPEQVTDIPPQKPAIINEDFDKFFDENEDIKSDIVQLPPQRQLPEAADERDAEVQPASAAVDTFAYIDKLHSIFGGDINYMRYDRFEHSLELTFGDVYIQINNLKEESL